MTTARRPLSLVLTAVASFVLFTPLAAHAADSEVRSTVSVASAAVSAVSDVATGADGTTTTIVASEAPVPNNPGAKAPEIGPIVVPTDTSSFSGAWWLVAFGGVQLVGLLLITRRARARLSLEDAQP